MPSWAGTKCARDRQRDPLPDPGTDKQIHDPCCGWADARKTVLALAAEEQPDPAALTSRPSITPAYAQIIAAFTGGACRLRAKAVCQALTEPEAGLFALATVAASAADQTDSGLLP